MKRFGYHEWMLLVLAFTIMISLTANGQSHNINKIRVGSTTMKVDAVFKIEKDSIYVGNRSWLITYKEDTYFEVEKHNFKCKVYMNHARQAVFECRDTIVKEYLDLVIYKFKKE